MGLRVPDNCCHLASRTLDNNERCGIQNTFLNCLRTGGSNTGGTLDASKCQQAAAARLRNHGRRQAREVFIRQRVTPAHWEAKGENCRARSLDDAGFAWGLDVWGGQPLGTNRGCRPRR